MKLGYIAKNGFYWILFLIGMMWMCSGCMSSRNPSSPCYSQTHYVGYSAGGFGSHRTGVNH